MSSAKTTRVTTTCPSHIKDKESCLPATSLIRTSHRSRARGYKANDQAIKLIFGSKAIPPGTLRQQEPPQNQMLLSQGSMLGTKRHHCGCRHTWSSPSPHHFWVTATSSNQQSSPLPPCQHSGPTPGTSQRGCRQEPKPGIMVCTKDNDSESCYWLFSKRNSFLLEN